MSDQNGARDLKSAIRELAVSLEQGLDDHPSRKELLDFAADDLPEPKRNQIEEHLALCHQCSRILDALTVEEPDLVHLTEKDLDAEWKRFQAAAGISRGPRRDQSWLLAAVLLFAVVSVVLFAVRLSQRPESQAAEPRIASRADLFPVILKRSGQSIEPEQQKAQVRVQDGAEEASLTLDLPGVERHPEYRLEIQTADGRRLWSRAGVQAQNDEAIGLIIPRSFLPQGEYRIRLFSPEGKEVAVYELLFEP